MPVDTSYLRQTKYFIFYFINLKIYLFNNRFLTMKKYLILAITLLNYSNLFSQKYKINWENSQDYALTNGQIIKVPFFNNPEHYALNEYYTPNYNVIFNETVRDVKIFNVETTALSPLELIQFKAYDLIKDEITYISQNYTENNKSKTLVSVFPYLKKGNVIHKINSFEISTYKNIAPKTLQNRSFGNATSVLKDGNWFKIKVDKTGVFKLDKKFFTQNGIPTSGYNLNTLKVYGNGSGRLFENMEDHRYDGLQEVPIEFIGSTDNSFDEGDYISFYAKGPHQWYRKQKNSLDDVFLRFNLYDDYSYYYITYDGDAGKRIVEDELTGTPTRIFTNFDAYQFHEKDSLNINQVGRQWVGEMLNGSNNFTKKFTAKQADIGQTAYLRYSVVGKNAENTSAKINVNGNPLDNIIFNVSDFNNRTLKQQFPLQGNEINVEINYTNASNPRGLAFINFIELKYKEKLQYTSDQFDFRSLEDLNTGEIFGFNIQNNSGIKVWNVSDISSTFQIKPSGNVYKYQSNSDVFWNEFVAFKEEDLYTDVQYVGRIVNQDIRKFNDVTLAIITPNKFKDQAIRLANFREEHDGIKVAVVTTEEVYNEFSSGSQDPIAIRDFFKYLKDNGNPLEYAILFGATTYDPKNRVQGNINYIPSFYNLNSESLETSSTTDDYFTMIGDNVNFAAEAGNGSYSYNAKMIDIAIGRLPASDISEAKTLVDKIISYYQKIPNKGNSYGDWRTKIVAVSDDPDKTEINTPKFDKDIDDTFNNPINKFYAVNKLYIDAYQPEQTSAGLRYPIINQSILNNLELGTNFMIYYGHGGPRSWAQERILTGEELSNLNNFTNTFSRIPIVATITCDFTVWDLPQYNSAGELMLKNPNGGALSMLTTNRPIGTIYGSEFNSYLLKELFRENNHQNLTSGQALIKAKQSYNPNSSDHARVNLLGDPMVAVSRPKQDISIVKFKVNGNEVDYKSHQIKALDFVEIEGEVLNPSSQIDGSFNGTVQNILYEKPIQKPLRNNKGLSTFQPYTFTEEFKTIYKGSSKVNEGKFIMKYYVPKDINFEVGERKIVLYAYSDHSDAVMNSKVIIGGINENGLNDSEIPQGKLYMNNLNFANGGITDRDPYLVACLTDNTGINATGSSIGHDIVATLDGQVQDSYVLNEYFESGDSNPCINKDFEDYQKGQVIYQLKKLELGQHKIDLKFWDINNNSNTATLDFVVMENGSNKLVIDKLLNWPNPFTNNTFFHFEHNCDSELDVMVQVFTVSGRLVKTIRQTVSAEPFREGYRTGKYALEWDGLDDFGDKIGKGTYLYKVNVKGLDTELCKGTATAIERLVILK